MLGAIAGDIIGSVFESSPVKTTNFDLFSDYADFTDDTVLTVAVADALLEGTTYLDRREMYVDKFHEYFIHYPEAGYGESFFTWAHLRQRKPYGSWGNGSAMRVSPVAYAYETIEAVLAEAKITAEVTHNHPEGIRGAQAVAASVFLARQRESKTKIKSYIETSFGYDLDQTLDALRPVYTFDVSCQGSVPQAIVAFLESDSFEDAVRKAVSIGGDSDTIACITGSIAEPFYGGVPEPIAELAIEFLDRRLKGVLEEFQLTYC